MRGKFIVIEGPDGAGKSTLAGGLARRFEQQGCQVVEVREPGGTEVAERARQLVLDPALEVHALSELFLLLAARADLVRKVIAPSLDNGAVVISDRYYYSTFAYQVAGRGLPAASVREANALATGGLEPDLTIVLDVAPDVGLERRDRASTRDRLELADAGFHERVAVYFRELSGPEIVHIDASNAAAAVLDDAWGLAQSLAQKKVR